MIKAPAGRGAETDDRQPVAGTVAGHRHGGMCARPLGHDKLSASRWETVGTEQARRLGHARRPDRGPHHIRGIGHVNRGERRGRVEQQRPAPGTGGRDDADLIALGVDGGEVAYRQR